jgi:hypothetical protein
LVAVAVAALYIKSGAKKKDNRNHTGPFSFSTSSSSSSVNYPDAYSISTATASSNTSVHLVTQREFVRAFEESSYLTEEHATYADVVARGHRSLYEARRAYATSLVLPEEVAGALHTPHASDASEIALSHIRHRAAKADRLCESAGCLRLARIPWKIAIIRRGLPHTLDDMICMPLEMFVWDSDALIKTLLHEKLHVFQRVHPAETQQIVSIMGYVRVGYRRHIQGPLSRRTRDNPDLDTFLYRHLETGCTPLAVFRDNEPTSLSDIEVVCVDPNTNTATTTADNTMDFGYEYEHPFEDMAYKVSEALTASTTSTIDPIRKWL